MGQKRKRNDARADDNESLRLRITELEQQHERLCAEIAALTEERDQAQRELIHPRTQTRRKTSEREQTLWALINAISESMLLTDWDGTILTCNETAARRLGRPIEELIGQSLLEPDPDLIPGDVARKRLELIRQVIRSGKAVLVGDERNGMQMDYSLYPVLDAKGVVRQVAIFAKDVTYQVEVDRVLHESAKRYGNLVDRVGEIVATLDCEGHCVSVNQAVHAILGYDPREVVGRRFTEFISREAVAAIEFQYGRALAGERVKGHTTLVHCGGGHFDFEYRMVPIVRDGCVVGVLGVTWDITERKRLERMLKESEERYRTVVESAGEAISIVDEAGTFQFMNSTAARALGGKASDFAGRSMWDLFPREIADRQMGTVRRVTQTGQGVNTVVLSTVGGRERWYNTTIEPLRDSSGAVTAALVVARDVHDLKTAQQELEAYRDRMERADHLASLGTLSAMLAHELTQPLTVIRLSIQNAMEDIKERGGCPAADDLSDGLAEVANVAAIVDRIRGFARRTSEKATSEVILSAVVRRMIRLLEESAHRARIDLRTEGLDTLPPIYTHEKDIEQVFFALAQNAIQAANGSRDCTLCIAGAERGDRVEVSFADDCGGIAPEHLDRVFDPFFTTKPPGEGTGLGLCVVQRIINQVGGELRMENRWGKGVSFTILVPVDRR